jgi:alpha-ribazole phosphatase
MWNRTENKIKLVLIRHGATRSNKEQRYLGKTDEGLSREGIEELKEQKRKGRFPQVDYLFSSPMKRCLKTAYILYPDKEPCIIPEWTEIDFGAFEGRNYIELSGDERYQEWIDSNGTLPFPEGESREAFIKRCEKGFYRMLIQLMNFCEKNSKQEISVGLTLNGGTIMSLLSHFHGGEYFDYRTKNGMGYICSLVWQEETVRLCEVEKL